MAKDHSLILRRGIVAHLKAYAPLVALVPAAQIHGEQPKAKPVWPFIRYGLPSMTLDRFNCYSGGVHAVTLHSFTRGPGTDNAYLVRAAIIEGLDDASITLEGDAGVTLITHSLSNLIRDTDEADVYHDIHQFSVSVLEKD